MSQIMTICSHWPKALHEPMLSFARRCSLLFWLAMLGLSALAAEGPADNLTEESVAVDYRDGTYFAQLGFRVAASPAVALDVLTDFNHMVGIVPNLESSRIVSRSGNVFVIAQRGRADFGPFSFRFDSQRRIELFPDGRLVAQALSGSTKHMRSELRIQAQGSGAHIDYQLEVIPDRWLPSSFGVRFMRHELAEQFTALRHEMERRQTNALLR